MSEIIDPAANLTDGAEQLRRRTYIGHRCLALAYDGPWSGLEQVANEDERDSAASDAISDILTAMFGPAGTYEYDGTQRPTRRTNAGAVEQAVELLDAALRAYKGDAEDYITEA